MPRLTIDNRTIDVPPGATILQAARQLEIPIPTLCYLDACPPPTSCLVCTVKILGGGLVPSCATIAVDGMQIESETEEVHQVRRSALELLLSDHLGDCLAPCQLACPAQMNIPQMLRQIAAGEFRSAIQTVTRDIALPAVLGRICPAPCEKACRRRMPGATVGLSNRASSTARPAGSATPGATVGSSNRAGAVAICRLKRFVADTDLASSQRYLPACQPPSGKRVAIIGAGPAGWSAAYYLLQQGHACTIFDQHPQPGGRLLHETSEDELPRPVLEADLQPVLLLGADFRPGTRIDGQQPFDQLRQEHDAVLVACGATAREQAEAWRLRSSPRGLQVTKGTYETSIPGVFAAGNAVRGKGLVIRSLADGKEAAVAIDQHLCGRPVTGPKKPFSTRIGRLEPHELALYLAGASDAPRRDPAAGPTAGFAPEEAVEQSARCMHCDCRGLETCRLRQYSDLYAADPRRYKDTRRTFRQDRQHAQVIYEPGKCIQCGLCIEIAARAGEPLGLTFIGRGFDVRVGVPLDGTLREALQKTAAECVAACPTAALSWADDPRNT